MGAGNLRSGTENGGQASVEGRILFVCVGGKVSKHTCKNNTKKSFSSKQGKAFLKFLPKHVGGSYALWYRLKDTWYTCCVCRISTCHYYLVYMRDKKKLWKLEYSQRYNVVRWLSVRVSIILPLCIAVSRPSQWRERSCMQLHMC